MARRPRLKSHFHAQVISGEGVFLVSERRPVLIAGHAAEVIVPLLDGRRTDDEIVEAVKGRVSPPHAYYLLALMRKGGYLAEGETTLAPGLAAFWSDQGYDLATVTERLAATPVSVVASCGLSDEPLMGSLRSLGVVMAADGDLDVVLIDDFLRAELAVRNHEALRRRRPWLPVKPVGRELWIGPIFSGGSTGCWECLAQRLRGNREVENLVQQAAGQVEVLGRPRPATEAAQSIAHGIAALRVAKWIVGGPGAIAADDVVSFDPTTGEQRFHRLIRQPFCPACGGANLPVDRLPPPLELHAVPKRFVADGGHRAVPPEETVARYGHHVSPITGVLGDLRPVEGFGDAVVKVYLAGDNRIVRGNATAAFRGIFTTQSGGKGVTDAQARASALCEALERYSGYFQGSEPRRIARQEELGGLGIHPNDVMQFSQRQYEERGRWADSRSNWVPRPFETDRAVDWSPLWSLTSQSLRYLPTGLCYYGRRVPEDGSLRADSNGAASGNTIEEAILQAFMELAERDAVGVWWYNRVTRPGVDLDSFDDPYPPSLRSFLARMGRDLWVLDITNDLGITAFGAFSRRTGAATERIGMGFGAHFDARIALRRSLTELTQMLTSMVPVEMGNVAGEPIDDPEHQAWMAEGSLARDRHLAVDAAQAPRRAADYPARWSADIRDDVQACQAVVARRGLEMLVLDQTRPDIGLPVVKVFVPGLRHCHRRLAPGRLYAVPVDMGWLDTPRTEQEMNPIAFFL